MNRTGTLILLAGSFAALDAHALEARQSPYQKIVERNVFQLHDPPIVLVTSTPKLRQLRKVTLTGITTILGRTAAFITIAGLRALPEESFIVVNGQIVNGIEVRSIDERAGAVRILNEGESQILNFDSAKPANNEPIDVLPKVPIIPTPTAQANLESTLTPEEQTALIELQRVKFQMEGDPVSTLLPPTELTTNDKDPATL